MARLRLVFIDGTAWEFEGTNEWVRETLDTLEKHKGEHGWLHFTRPDDMGVPADFRVGYNSVAETYSTLDE
ncbi:hypothetical protein E7T09_04140 [Deinococcus sp. KSM4-11]|uniref:hypothetical protein n=1 Tax=Deinococcus sp. KSM4-11 TaxID=2568654 RepID=UPI0010A2A9CF|nr:hypothetical protein [Deinococcus sp. KSM4-11]THF88404.1 hypothetical protein E7T09_04140 [Deinococcus sp. KSM4-11]